MKNSKPFSLPSSLTRAQTLPIGKHEGILAACGLASYGIVATMANFANEICRQAPTVTLSSMLNPANWTTAHAGAAVAAGTIAAALVGLGVVFKAARQAKEASLKGRPSALLAASNRQHTPL